ncbi:beta-phosphoglucomutase [Carnobacterium inhibens]|jgi:beta-phosphoglucomutase|uniref:Beta-phosphoglucomutase n=1 Tax=Carnobacterium inhibens subsp. gilichinskyi TaxID=1266845 RepID=U5SCN9_9LACT|nr:beta-phosphoglucomutase [Carnobacterium inhibens]AGY81868.1 beta-phosphoglucomutase [Carnobacterium inhibens subsp. gilichinskyi]MCM3511286.1 beta-phosphoglucomutase [Carnobacterium inhibens]
MIKGFIFDLDGVLTDTAEYHYLAWKKLADRLGIQLDRKMNEQLKGISRMDSLDRILAIGNQMDRYTLEEKEKLADEKNEDYKELILEVTPNDLLPGIANLLADLRAKDIRLALASASKNGPVIMERLGIADMFDTVVDPATLAKGKPDPEIFIKGAQQLKLKPIECVGVEDAQAGIKSINAAGIFSVGVGTKEMMKEADYAVTSTKELKLEEILKRANQ